MPRVETIKVRPSLTEVRLQSAFITHELGSAPGIIPGCRPFLHYRLFCVDSVHGGRWIFALLHGLPLAVDNDLRASCRHRRKLVRVD